LRCDLCGEELEIAEWLAVRYTCLSSCIPLLRGRHVAGTHRDFYLKARKIGSAVTYSASVLAATAIYSLMAGSYGAVLISASITVALLVFGSLYRLRLLAMHRGRVGPRPATIPIH